MDGAVKEQLVTELSRISKKKKAAINAKGLVLGEMEEIGEEGLKALSPPEAARIGLEFAVRYLEYERLELAEVPYYNEIKTGKPEKGWFHSPNMASKFGDAIRMACHGDYTGVKKLLRIEYSPSYAGPIKERLDIISERMPDSGEPFIMPSPAWMDSRFSGEQDSSSQNP